MYNLPNVGLKVPKFNTKISSNTLTLMEKSKQEHDSQGKNRNYHWPYRLIIYKAPANTNTDNQAYNFTKPFFIEIKLSKHN